MTKIKVSNLRDKNVILFGISKAVLDLKLHVIIINDTFVKRLYVYLARKGFKYSTDMFP